MRIESPEQIRDAFSIFHDGRIRRSLLEETCVVLSVKIDYLAKRVNPDFSAFTVRMAGVSNMTFTTWPNDPQSKPAVLAKFETIFRSELEILEARLIDQQIEVICNQPATDFDYCGGELRFGVASIEVFDEAGKSYTAEELEKLCKDYWDDWSRRNQP